MNILITGVGGNVGRFLAEYFSKTNNVIGTYRNTKPKNANYSLMHSDLSEGVPHMEGTNIDVIIHAAAAIHGSIEELIRDNIIATRNLIEFAFNSNVKKFIYLSTVSIYGETTGVLSESSPIVNPEPYGVTKYLAEQMVLESDIPEKIVLQLPRMLGPFVDVENIKGSGFISMTRKLVHNENITCFIPDEVYNNFMHVSDLSRFIEILLTDQRWEADRLLLGAGGKLTMMEILSIMRDAMNSKSKLFRGTTDILPKCSRVSIELAKKYGFKPCNASVCVKQFAVEMKNFD